MYCYKVKRNKNYFFIISIFVILLVGGIFLFNSFFNNETQVEYNTTKLGVEEKSNSEDNKYNVLEKSMKAIVRNIEC